jgi:AraC-like DNA-binding protein
LNKTAITDDNSLMNWALGYREWAPPDALSLALACLWVRVVPSEGAPPALVLPDACVDLIWQQGCGAHVAGPDTGPAPTPLPPGAILVGARFRPGAGGPALGLPLNELLNLRVDLSDLHPKLDRQLPATLTPSEALRHVGRAAADLITEGPPDVLISQVSGRLAQPQTRVEALAKDLGLSERQVRRRFRAAVGYGPKTLQRVLRFQRLLAYMDAQPADAELARVALDLGYADQPHLTRECARLSGLPPAALARTRARRWGPPAAAPLDRRCFGATSKVATGRGAGAYERLEAIR